MRSPAAALLMSVMLFASHRGIAQTGSGKPASPCTEWKAWHNLMPGTSPATLHITATCHFPTSGYSVELVPSNGKGKNGNVLELRKVVHKPEGMALQVLSDVPLQYTKETPTEYKTVVIRPDKVRVAVEAVH